MKAPEGADVADGFVRECVMDDDVVVELLICVTDLVVDADDVADDLTCVIDLDDDEVAEVLT